MKYLVMNQLLIIVLFAWTIYELSTFIVIRESKRCFYLCVFYLDYYYDSGHYYRGLTMTMIIDLETFNESKTSCHSGSEINWTLSILADTEISTQMKKNAKRERLTNWQLWACPIKTRLVTLYQHTYIISKKNQNFKLEGALR